MLHHPARDFGETCADGVVTIGEAAEHVLWKLRLKRHHERALRRMAGGVNHVRLRQELLRMAFPIAGNCTQSE